MKFLTPRAALLSSLLAVPLPAAADTVHEFKTPLFGMNAREELVLRVVDAEGIPGGPEVRVQAAFFVEDGDMVAETEGTLTPGAAWTFRLSYAALGSAHAFPALRARIRLLLPGDGLQNHPLVNFEFHDVQTHQARPGGTCTLKISNPLAPPPGGGREWKCVGASTTEQ